MSKALITTMSKILRGLFFSLFFIFKITTIHGQLSEVHPFATLDSNVMLIGDKGVLHVGINHGDKDRVLAILPEMPLDTPVFEVSKAGKFENGRLGVYRDINFTVWDTGLYKIPSVVFTIQHANGDKENYSTPTLLLTVNNPKDVDKMLQIAPIKDIVAEDLAFEDVLPYFMILAAVTLLSVVGFLIYKRLKNKPDPMAIQRIIIHPPHIVAAEKLRILKEKALWQRGEVKEYYSELSYILREYLEKRFNIPALESTTDELVGIIRSPKMTALNEPFYFTDKIKNLLQTADLAKFAKVLPPENVHDNFWFDAAEVVEKTKPEPIENVENQEIKP